jgi:predicted small secreted protein
MRKAAALVAAGLVLAGCSSTVQGVASPAEPDGSQ